MVPVEALADYLKQFNTELCEPRPYRTHPFLPMPEASKKLRPKDYENFREKVIKTDIAEAVDELNINLHFLLQPVGGELITAPIARISKKMIDMSEVVDYMVCHAIALGQNSIRNYLCVHPHLREHVSKRHSDPSYLMEAYPSFFGGIISEFLNFPDGEIESHFEGLKIHNYE